MIGYSEEEISNTVEEWKSRVHPADLKRVKKHLQDCLDGEIPHYETEHRLKTKDGSYRWILDRGKVVSRDDNGKRYVHSTFTPRNLKIAWQAGE